MVNSKKEKGKEGEKKKGWPLCLHWILSFRLNIEPGTLTPKPQLQTIPLSWSSTYNNRSVPGRLLCLANSQGPHLNRQLGLLNPSVKRFKLFPLPSDSDDCLNLAELGFGFHFTIAFKVVRFLHDCTCLAIQDHHHSKDLFFFVFIILLVRRAV
ncbi:hypothetical protein SLEP1_g17054 [Rubroshorea leprosula]|uniref:Uncharacterized protein n=1 Tax=Rubroshorea leprosula TaxID=152421 RepID=A0AAV5J1T2_9ROSI|nr:hypothetical protein SLEP1_g17054 [Rubroshorea leprosula]